MAKNKPTRKKATNNKQQQQISPANYIMQAARKVPIYECLINEGWEEGGMAQIFVARKKQSGNIILGVYIVDTFCLGLKNTMFQHSMSEYEYEQHKKQISRNTEMEWEKLSPNTCFNIVYGAIEYAEDLGFMPNKDFSITEYILDDVESLEFEEIEFGRDGKPYYFAGPYDDTSKVIAKLKKAVGEDGFHFTLPMGGFSETPDDFDKYVRNEYEDDDFDDEYDDEDPHLPMIGFDFDFHKDSDVDFRKDFWLKQKAEKLDIELQADELILNEVLDFDEETLEIVIYMLNNYAEKASRINLYLTMVGSSLERQKKKLYASFFEKDDYGDYSIDAEFTTSTLTAHFPRLAEYKNLKNLIETSPMNKYMDRLIQYLIENPTLKDTLNVRPFIAYGEKEGFAESEDHVSIGFTIE